MAKYIITLETDNEDISEVESCLEEMINNHLNCTEGIYEIRKERCIYEE